MVTITTTVGGKTTVRQVPASHIEREFKRMEGRRGFQDMWARMASHASGVLAFAAAPIDFELPQPCSDCLPRERRITYQLGETFDELFLSSDEDWTAKLRMIDDGAQGQNRLKWARSRYRAWRGGESVRAPDPACRRCAFLEGCALGLNAALNTEFWVGEEQIADRGQKSSDATKKRRTGMGPAQRVARALARMHLGTPKACMEWLENNPDEIEKRIGELAGTADIELVERFKTNGHGHWIGCLRVDGKSAGGRRISALLHQLLK